MNIDIIDGILRNHGVIRDIAQGINRPILYEIGEGIDLYIKQNQSNIVMWAFDNKIDEFVDLEEERYSYLLSGFKAMAFDFKIHNKVYKIKLDLTKVISIHKGKLDNEKREQRKIVGYCRIGRLAYVGDNEIGKQEKEILKAYPNAIIHKEVFTGTELSRPVIDSLLEELKAGDMLVVTRLDRLALKAKDGITILDKLFRKNVIVHVLNVGVLENSTLGRFFIQTILATVEMESTLIRERIEEGKELAKKNPNFKDGRPKTYKDEQLNEALAMLSVNGGNLSYDTVAEITKISKSTLIRENKKRKNKS